MSLIGENALVSVKVDSRQPGRGNDIDLYQKAQKQKVKSHGTEDRGEVLKKSPRAS